MSKGYTGKWMLMFGVYEDGQSTTVFSGVWMHMFYLYSGGRGNGVSLGG